MFLSLAVLIVFGNLAVVDYFVYTSTIGKSASETAPTFTPTSSSPPATQSFCPASCLLAIQDATSAAVPQPSPKQQSKQKTMPKELYIPLGTGFTQSNEWVDVAGTDTTINSANYTKITRAVFEASMHIPVANGTMFARLFNVTAGHPVWFSEVSTGAGTSVMVSSGDITLDKGSNIYRVQIKTSLQYASYLDFARIRIMTEE